ncbi:hypothetical protein [Streptomyces sp. cg36]|uniref:hypothetical protein n=1 Tax=Streptomyces sp. cg36 TaxID=3238798 RepID=UPI0034E1F855
MSRFMVIGPSRHGLGYCHRITRDAWSGQVLALRCPGCHQGVWVDGRQRIARHHKSPDVPDACGLSGLHVIDTARA